MASVEQLFSVKGKVAVVTGGLGLLGTEYVKTLLEAGAKVVVFDIKPPADSHELHTYAKTYPLAFIALDITKRAEVDEALKKITSDWGVPSVLINNAAINFVPKKGAAGSFEEYPLDEWNSVVDVNLTGTLICSQVIGGAMAKAGRGSIINISSHYGVVSPDQRIYSDYVKPVSYSVTKSGILNLTRYLATYWGSKGVRVNTLVPGGVFDNQEENFVKGYGERTPLGRMAKRDEYNGAILFLASDASSYMTGSTLVMDGGWTAW